MSLGPQACFRGTRLEHVNTKNLSSNPYHNHTRRKMLTQLPAEIANHIVEYLGFEDIRSIVRVCFAFRLPAQLRLFRTIDIGSDPYT